MVPPLGASYDLQMVRAAHAGATPQWLHSACTDAERGADTWHFMMQAESTELLSMIPDMPGLIGMRNSSLGSAAARINPMNLTQPVRPCERQLRRLALRRRAPDRALWHVSAQSDLASNGLDARDHPGHHLDRRAWSPSCNSVTRFLIWSSCTRPPTASSTCRRLSFNLLQLFISERQLNGVVRDLSTGLANVLSLNEMFIPEARRGVHLSLCVCCHRHTAESHLDQLYMSTQCRVSAGVARRWPVAECS